MTGPIPDHEEVGRKISVALGALVDGLEPRQVVRAP